MNLPFHRYFLRGKNSNFLLNLLHYPTNCNPRSRDTLILVVLQSMLQPHLNPQVSHLRPPGYSPVVPTTVIVVWIAVILLAYVSRTMRILDEAWYSCCGQSHTCDRRGRLYIRPLPWQCVVVFQNGLLLLDALSCLKQTQSCSPQVCPIGILGRHSSAELSIRSRAGISNILSWCPPLSLTSIGHWSIH